VGGPALGHDGGDTSVAPWCWCVVVMLGQTTPSVARQSVSVESEGSRARIYGEAQ
jgi:hypothetical protein